VRLRRRKDTALVKAAEQLGRTLGRAAGTIDRLNRRRHDIIAELDRIVAVAGRLRDDLKPARRPARKMAKIATRALRRARRRV
jgi:ABC-type transporter Mla subunit MlaD